MSRVVIEIHPGENGEGFEVLLSEPEGIPDGWISRPFPYDRDHPIAVGFAQGQGSVSDMGGYLAAGLRAHPAIGLALDGLALAPNDRASAPVFIRLTPDAEDLPWETLFDKDAFLALDVRSPVARMGREGGRRSPTLDFQPPLRVMAVLGAAGVDATAEWEALYGALRKAAFPVSIRVLVAQDELLAHIPTANDPNVTVSVGTVPPGREILDAIADFRPNILHVFSHGRVSHGFPEIQVATLTSWDVPDHPGQVVLDPQSLATAAVLQSAWIVTLNCCRGAEGGAAGSFAYSLAAMGFPVVAAMREPVADTDANAFSRGFYRSVVELIGAAAVAGREVDLDLSAALYEPRMEICEEHRGGSSPLAAAVGIREWTLPVLYVRPGGLAVRRSDPAAAAAVSAEERSVLETKMRFLQGLILEPVPGMPPEAIDAIRAEVARIKETLYGK